MVVKEDQWVSGKYRLLRRLGVGGMAEVWSARNELTNRDFAIKFLLPALARRDDAVERFVREARATGQLRHPNLVSVFDAGRTRDGRPYLVMELLSGESLEERLDRVKRLSQATTCMLMSQVASALHAAHGAGVVHRDLSSANVFLVTSEETGEETTKILDFGVSKFMGPVLDERVRTEGGAVLGSPAYMSPEQAQGADSVDSRTDLWALGVLMYECLCGERPFVGSNYNALIYKIINSPHRSLRERAMDIHPELADLIDSCLVKDPSAREYSARSIAERLEQLAYVLSAGTSTPITPRRRATDRLSNRPELARTVRPALGSVGLSPSVLPAPVRWWLALTRNGNPLQLIAAGSALFGAAIGITLGVLMATASDHSRVAAGSVSASQATAVAMPATQCEPIGPTDSEGEPPPPEPSSKKDSASRSAEKPTTDLAESVQRALEFELKPTPEVSNRPAVYLSKSAPR